ncbi:hypothetical protein, partial [Streptomyces chryseus]|uniref:hypothetical protein n=1 Tax=Streptomyces chryseus TaxID=68186 RepID=UPI0035716A7B
MTAFSAQSNDSGTDRLLVTAGNARSVSLFHPEWSQVSRAWMAWTVRLMRRVEQRALRVMCQDLS